MEETRKLRGSELEPGDTVFHGNMYSGTTITLPSNSSYPFSVIDASFSTGLRSVTDITILTSRGDLETLYIRSDDQFTTYRQTWKVTNEFK